MYVLNFNRNFAYAFRLRVKRTTVIKIPIFFFIFCSFEWGYNGSKKLRPLLSSRPTGETNVSVVLFKNRSSDVFTGGGFPHIGGGRSPRRGRRRVRRRPAGEKTRKERFRRRVRTVVDRGLRDGSVPRVRPGPGGRSGLRVRSGSQLRSEIRPRPGTVFTVDGGGGGGLGACAVVGGPRRSVNRSSGRGHDAAVRDGRPARSGVRARALPGTARRARWRGRPVRRGRHKLRPVRPR